MGLAAAFIQTSEQLRPALEALLGKTVLVRDRAAAKRLRDDLPGLRLVTLRGEVFRPGWFDSGWQGNPRRHPQPDSGKARAAEGPEHRQRRLESRCMSV